MRRDRSTLTSSGRQRAEEALAIISDLGPKRAYLTHLNHDILHARDSKLLPDNVKLGYDELVVEQS